MAASAADLLATARDALASGDFDGAVTAAHAAVAIEDSADGQWLLGELCFMDDRMAAAQRHVERAFRGLRDAGRLQEAARAALDLAAWYGAAGDHSAVGRGWAERARILLERVGPCVEWGYLELAIIACDRTDMDDLLASTARALEIALAFGDSDLEALAMADSGLALVTQGHTRDGFARLDAALAAIVAGEVGPRTASLCLCSMLAACDRAGDLRRAEEWTALINNALAGTANRPRALYTHCRVAYGSVLCAAGRWPEAEALMLEALGAPEAPALAHRALTVAHLATLRVEQGRIEEAAELLAPFEDRLTSVGPLAQIHARQGEWDLAVAVLRRGLAELVGDALRAVPLLVQLVELELRRGAIDAARAAAAQLDAIAADADLDAIHADAALARARVAAATGDHDAAVDEFNRAKARLVAADRPLPLAMVRLDLAAALRAAGDTPAAVTEARAALAACERLGAATGRDRAAALLRDLGATGRPPRRPPVDTAASLTRREHEVLDLLSKGLSNAEIGARLYISAKTAEHHVGRVLTKLGVRSRAEAAALAVRLAAATEN